MSNQTTKAPCAASHPLTGRACMKPRDHVGAHHSSGPGYSHQWETMGGDDTMADARLIAAAPDLLAELRNIANADPSQWDAETRDQFREWAQNRARAAIAKAEGRNHG